MMAPIVAYHRIPQFPYSLFVTHTAPSLHRTLSQSYFLSLSRSPQSVVTPPSTRWHSSSSAHCRIPTPVILSQLYQTRLCPRLPIQPLRSATIATAITTARSFHAALPRRRDYHFDTLKLVQRLREEGLTEEQSVAMMKVLSDVIEER